MRVGANGPSPLVVAHMRGPALTATPYRSSQVPYSAVGESFTYSAKIFWALLLTGPISENLPIKALGAECILGLQNISPLYTRGYLSGGFFRTGSRINLRNHPYRRRTGQQL